MFNRLRSRIAAAEQATGGKLPGYWVTLNNGTSAKYSAIDLLLYLQRIDAGEPLPDISDIQDTGATLPAGAAWRDLQERIKQKGA